MIVGVTRLPEQLSDLLIRGPVDEPSLADHGLATSFDDLTPQPGEVLLCLGGRRQQVDRVLHRDRAQRLEPPPDLDAQIGGLRRQLMNQQQPPGAAFGVLASIRCIFT